MLDTLVEKCIQNNITKINGYYYKTVKNAMVSDLYARFGFKQISSNNNGDSVWELDLHNYKNKNNVITVNSEKELVINE